VPNDLAAADRNMLTTWRNVLASGPSPGVVDGDGVVLLSSGVPVGLFNPAFVTRPPSDGQAIVDRVVAHYDDLRLPFVLYFRDETAPGLASVCEAAGLVENFQPPLMVLDPIPLAATTPTPADLSIEEVSAANIDQYGDVLAEGFAMPRKLVELLLGPSLLDIDEFTGFLGTIDGAPVATSAVFVADGLAGVYNVATVPAARGKGVGAALTWAAALARASSDVTGSILQASAAGEPVYTRMGYETRARYRQFEPRGAS
jgi:hypothetical protein